LGTWGALIPIARA